MKGLVVGFRDVTPRMEKQMEYEMEGVLPQECSIIQQWK